MVQLHSTMKRTNVGNHKEDLYTNEDDVGDDDDDDDDKTLHLNQRERQEKRQTLSSADDGSKRMTSINSIHRSTQTHDNNKNNNNGSDGNRDDNDHSSSVRTAMTKTNAKANTSNNNNNNNKTLAQLSIEDQEDVVRSMQIRNPLTLTVLGFYAACKVMLLYLINVETLVACGISGGMTVYWYNYGTYQVEVLGNEWNGGGMDYVILAFAVTSPIAAAIGMAFTRRERALFEIADFQSFAHQLYMAHSLWDWDHDDDENNTNNNNNNNKRGDEEDGGGHGGRTVMTTRTTQTMMTNKSAHDGTSFDFHIDRSKLRLKHSDAVLTQLIGIGDEMARFLSLPTQNRSIHRMTGPGKRQAAETVQVAYRLLHSMTSHRLTRLAVYGERIKKAGLPSGEVSRIRQYERFLEDNVKRLRMIKAYRTPQAFRSFARLFTIFLPPFYAPTYAQVAIDTHSLGLGVAFGVVTALALTALFESLQVLEDPFVATLKLDGIDCREEFQVLLWNSLVNTRRSIFPNAQPFPEGRRKALDFDKVHVERDDAPTDIPSPTTAKPSRETSVASFNTKSGQVGADRHGSYTRIFDIAGASRYPHSLHAHDVGSQYREEQPNAQDENEQWMHTGNDKDEINEEIYQSQTVRNDIHPPPVVVTRTDSLEFGDPWDDDELDLDLDSFTINAGDTEEGKGSLVVGGGGGGGANSVGLDIDLQLPGTGDNLVDGRMPYSAPGSVAASSVAMSQHTNVGVMPAASRGGRGTQHNLHRRIKSTASDSIASNIGVRESDYERDRVRPRSPPPPSPRRINGNNNMSLHHDRARAKTTTSIPSKIFDRPGSPSLG